MKNLVLSCVGIIMLFLFSFNFVNAVSLVDSGSYYNCSDNTTLRKTTYFNNFTGGSWFNESRVYDTKCDFGCNPTTNECKTSNLWSNIWIVLILMAIITIFYFIANGKGV